MNVSLLGCSLVFQGHLSNLEVTEDTKAPPHVHVDGLMRQDCTITPLLMLRIIILPPNEVGGRVYWIHRLSVCPSFCRWHGFQSATQVCFGISISYTCCLWLWAEACWFSTMSLSKFATCRLYWIFGVWTLTLIWLWISSSNFSGTSLACIGRSVLIFSNVTFKMATWRPYWILLASTPSLVAVAQHYAVAHRQILCLLYFEFSEFLVSCSPFLIIQFDIWRNCMYSLYWYLLYSM